MRINSASDDAAGIAVASGLRADARLYTQGIRNLNDGLSAISIADGALGELATVTTRIQELAEQAANGTLSASQRNGLNSEASSLRSEFNRLVSSVKFNGQSLLDLTVNSIRLQAGYGDNGSLSFLLGNDLKRTIGTGTFASRSSVSVTGNPTGTRAVDINGDGVQDLVFAENSGGTFGVALGNGDGTFGATITTTGNGASAGFTVADFDGDGKLDAVAASSTGAGLMLFRGNGDGTFQTGEAISNSTLMTRLDSADFNGDGKLDLISNNASNGSLVIRLGNGDGTFGTATSYGSGAGASTRQMVVIDFDRDGRLDVVSVNNSSSVSIFKGNGLGGFTQSSFSINGNAQGLSVGDFDGDGRYDVAVSYNAGGANGQVQTFLQQSDGSFTLGQTFGSSVNGQQLAMGDFNGDGIPDIIATNTTNTSVMVLMGRGDGTFTSQTLTANGTTNHGVIEDFNGDGVVDIMVRDSSTSFAFFRSNTTQTTTLQRLSLYDQADAKTTLTLMKAHLERTQ